MKDQMAAQIGRVLGGRYQLVEPLGRGRSAQAFLADDVRLQRQVTVKLLHRRLAGDEEFLRRFRSEAQAAAALSHPHVLAVYDWGEDLDGIPWLVTEHLGGGSLRGLLDRGHRLTPSQALVVGVQAARGLDHAHGQGIVHRDVRPANLLFGDDGRLRVADFGLARALAEAASSEPGDALAATARYASPEQAQGSQLTDRADVYSLALTLVEAVTGVVPFARDTTLGTLMARVDRPLEVPLALGPLAGPVAEATEPHPDDRPSAAALITELVRTAPSLPRPGAMPLAGPVGPDEDETRVVPGDPPSPSSLAAGADPIPATDPSRPVAGTPPDPTRSWRPPEDPPGAAGVPPPGDATVTRSAPGTPPPGRVDPTRPPSGATPAASSPGHASAAAEPPLDPTRVERCPSEPRWGDEDEEWDEDEEAWEDDDWDPRSPTGRRRRWPRLVATMVAVGVVVAVIGLLVADLVGPG